MPLNKNAALALAKGLGGSTKPKLTHKNGLACPDCGEPLVDPEMVIHLDPPRKRTLCQGCGYKGWRPIEEQRKEDDGEDRKADRALPDEDGSFEVEHGEPGTAILGSTEEGVR